MQPPIQPDEMKDEWISITDELPGAQDSLDSTDRSDDSISEDECWIDLRSKDENEKREFEEPKVFETKYEDIKYEESAQRLDLGRQQNKSLIPRRSGRNSGRIGKRIQKRIGLKNFMPARKSTFAFRKLEQAIETWVAKICFGLYRCQVCKINWQSGKSWVKITDLGRIGKKFGQVCRECDDGGHRIFVQPHQVIFYGKRNDDKIRNRDKRDPFKKHEMNNCEMCIKLGGGKKCFQWGRSLLFKEANEASEAYTVRRTGRRRASKRNKKFKTAMNA